MMLIESALVGRRDFFSGISSAHAGCWTVSALTRLLCECVRVHMRAARGCAAAIGCLNTCFIEICDMCPETGVDLTNCLCFNFCLELLCSVASIITPGCLFVLDEKFLKQLQCLKSL